MEMIRANREADAEPAGNLRQPGRPHAHEVIAGYVYLISSGAGMEDGAASGQHNADGPGPDHFQQCHAHMRGVGELESAVVATV